VALVAMVNATEEHHNETGGVDSCGNIIEEKDHNDTKVIEYCCGCCAGTAMLVSK